MQGFLAGRTPRRLQSGVVAHQLLQQPTKRSLQLSEAPFLTQASCPAPACRLQVALLLLEAGADPRRLDFSGRNALDLAVLHGSLAIMQPLLDGGCWFTCSGSGEQWGGGAVEREGGAPVIRLGWQGMPACFLLSNRHTQRGFQRSI